MRVPKPKAERFWAKVMKTPTCWNWTASRFAGRENGYGHFYADGRDYYAHRFAWSLARGPIPKGVMVLHRCDNMKCVRPKHLFLGSGVDNMQDCRRKGRLNTAKGDKHYTRRRPELVRRGEQHPMAKLTCRDVRRIRRLLARGKTQSFVARTWGISQPTVSRIATGGGWRNVL